MWLKRIAMLPAPALAALAAPEERWYRTVVHSF
jgi:hypothetical protein